MGITEIIEYRETSAALALLRERYAAPFDVTTASGMIAAKAARAEVRGYRVALEKTRAAIKKPVLAKAKMIDAEAKRITAELLAIESPIDAAIKEEERMKAEEKAAFARANEPEAPEASEAPEKPESKSSGDLADDLEILVRAAEAGEITIRQAVCAAYRKGLTEREPK